MKISVIIPTLNEEQCVGAAVVRAAAAYEVIVTDGGSSDGTVAVATTHGARVVTSAPGRGRQMNRGAAEAAGDTLLFLHADTLLPGGFETHVARVLSGGACAGAFRLQIDSPQWSLRVIERAVNVRSRVFGMPYGDQALFLRAAIFGELGGYADIAAMEDFDLVRRLRRRGRIEVAEACVVTSARRWLRCGVIRTTVLNQALVLAWLGGVSADRIARWRFGEESLPTLPQAGEP